MSTSDYRVEHDSMGALEVPATALWGAQTQRAIQNFPPSGLAHAARLHPRARASSSRPRRRANAELGALRGRLAARHPGGGRSKSRRGDTTLSFRSTCSRPARAPAAT